MYPFVSVTQHPVHTSHMRSNHGRVTLVVTLCWSNPCNYSSPSMKWHLGHFPLHWEFSYSGPTPFAYDSSLLAAVPVVATPFRAGDTRCCDQTSATLQMITNSHMHVGKCMVRAQTIKSYLGKMDWLDWNWWETRVTPIAVRKNRRS